MGARAGHRLGAPGPVFGQLSGCLKAAVGGGGALSWVDGTRFAFPSYGRMFLRTIEGLVSPARPSGGRPARRGLSRSAAGDRAAARSVLDGPEHGGTITLEGDGSETNIMVGYGLLKNFTFRRATPMLLTSLNGVCCRRLHWTGESRHDGKVTPRSTDTKCALAFEFFHFIELGH
jgi:hypothetical protein